jgi:hypothetical protein
MSPIHTQISGLVFEDCLKNMRLLSLATLATQHEEIPYSVIANTLSIDEGDVESWIILSISTRILDAKLDQLRRVAIIKYVPPIDKANWWLTLAPQSSDTASVLQRTVATVGRPFAGMEGEHCCSVRGCGETPTVGPSSRLVA